MLIICSYQKQVCSSSHLAARSQPSKQRTSLLHCCGCWTWAPGDPRGKPNELMNSDVFFVYLWVVSWNNVCLFNVVRVCSYIILYMFTWLECVYTGIILCDTCACVFIDCIHDRWIVGVLDVGPCKHVRSTILICPVFLKDTWPSIHNIQ